MYTIQQLQALDFLVKSITKTNGYALYQRNLKLVIELNNSYWYGDFVEMENRQVRQLYIDHLGDIECDSYHARDGNKPTTILKQISETFDKTLEGLPKSNFGRNPFTKLDNLPLFFETIVKVLSEAKITEVPTPFRPYLLNAHTIDGKFHLPFIDLENERIKLVSIIDITD
ncbi:hypothetical protein ABNB59_14760 [Paenibacillus larvae]|uniref:Uncharacterized protein n=3 Tax=root TaxID=1 RepID=A0A0K2CYX7_9CAUD|nr:hypothetical protein [Paenibacillus larvae]YP_009193869.1 hypothetical protein HARRISON_56 [Paenibacillus phage Harrison]ALA12617.1 hypothetical protein PAISLEY_56 [Paenibacillus phage Paisley]QVV19449.1 hypothetical protein Bert_47 [Paenibacillus phage Bert]QVV19850.1 hypothetical protein Mock2_47 [Paenibacillus phage Mock2]UYL93237.1 hypothetical protein CALLAN_48 [Paenibacillus phage Callan]UYL93315.1 hypothetical protein DASH_50 [Paenibacillus phage Dash]